MLARLKPTHIGVHCRPGHNISNDGLPAQRKQAQKTYRVSDEAGCDEQYAGYRQRYAFHHLHRRNRTLRHVFLRSCQGAHALHTQQIDADHGCQQHQHNGPQCAYLFTDSDDDIQLYQGNNNNKGQLRIISYSFVSISLFKILLRRCLLILTTSF